MQMLENLLIERLKLKLHWEQKTESVAALIVGKGGPKIATAKDDSESGFHRLPGGGLGADRTSMAALALLLSRWEDRPVVDVTGLDGYYAVELHSGKPGVPDSLDAAIAVERLGLKLEFRKMPIDHLVIDSGEKIPDN
jgi:uncharacterized protein (TIGR03435 family)